MGKDFNKFIPKSARLKLALSFVLFILAFYSLFIIKFAAQVPTPYQINSRQRPLTTEIFDRRGKSLYQIYEGQNRQLVRLNQLPKHLVQATIAIEDKHFYTHPGIDPLGIARALRIQIAEGKVQGGSTITQQLIKNTLLTPDQTISRKIKEVILAFWTERIYSKDEILQMYFNEAPYGGPAWGIEAASQMYFGKNAKDLSLSESAFLAGLPVAPTEYSPFGVNPEQGNKRQREVLRRMVEDGYISQDEANAAASTPLVFKAPLTDIKAPHFVMYIRSVLASKYGEKTVSQGGLKVFTTLDLDTQEAAEEVVSSKMEDLERLKVGNAAAMVTDPQTGQILAMVGSKDYFNKENGNFNVALALRQPGSSIKVVTYTTAFKQGYAPNSQLLDTPTSFPNPWGQAYIPVNYDGAFHGPVTIRTALGSSYNIPAVKMLSLVGIPAMLQTAKDMGITTLTDTKNYGLSLTLGGGAVKMIEMMTVYGTLANGGVKHEANGILKVLDSSGNIIEDHTNPQGREVITPEVAYLVSNVLSDPDARAPAFGRNSGLEIKGHTVAVKTGTSDNKRDNWCFGYTPSVVVGVWVGNNNNSPMDPSLTSGITGATPIWHDLMNYLLLNQQNIAFKKPAGIIEKEINGKKDIAISGQTPKTVLGYKKIMQKDEATGEEKEVISFYDPFSTYIPKTDQQNQKTTQ